MNLQQNLTCLFQRLGNPYTWTESCLLAALLAIVPLVEPPVEGFQFQISQQESEDNCEDRDDGSIVCPHGVEPFRDRTTIG